MKNEENKNVEVEVKEKKDGIFKKLKTKLSDKAPKIGAFGAGTLLGAVAGAFGVFTALVKATEDRRSKETGSDDTDTYTTVDR